MTSDVDDPRNKETLDAPPSSRRAGMSPVSSRRPAPGFTTRWFGDPLLAAKRRERWWTAGAVVLLLLLSYAFRIPPLLNARSTNSDAAVVGLQAMHILRGEWSPFLWGSGYQTSADAIVAAAFFRVLGATPFALMFSALTLHVIATLLVFWTLRRRMRTGASLILTLPLVFSPSSVHTYALYPPRQLALTLALASFWAIGGAGATEEDDDDTPETGRLVWLFVGGVLISLAITADPYPLLLVPLVGLFAIMVAKSDATYGDMLKRLMPFVSGALAGLVPFVLIRRATGAKSGPLGLTTDMLGHHFELLVKECLPWALSYKVYFARNVMDYRPWQPPLAIETIQISGALVVLVLVLYGLGAPFLRSLPWPIRRFGLVGALTYPLAIGAFMVSVMSMDHFSMRYLVVLTLMLPFAAAPAAAALGARRFFAVLLPHLVASAIGGWVGYGPFVNGVKLVRETPELADDYALSDLMRSRNLTYAMADYWASYRLTFLFAEKIIVVPTNDAEDRRPEYRRAFGEAPVFAYVWDPGRSREKLEEAERELVKKHASVEKLKAGGHTVFIVTRQR